MEDLLSKLHAAEPEQRANAVRALGHVEQIWVVEPVIGALTDPDDMVRRAAVLALINLGRARLLAEAIGRHLLSKLTHENREIRALAARVLGRLQYVPAWELLIGLTQDRKPEVRCEALLALAQIAPHQSVDHLIAALKDSAALIRKSAAGALHDVGDERAFAPLLDVLSDSNVEVRANSVYALGRIGDEKALPALLALQQRDSSVTSSGHPIRYLASQAIKDIVDRGQEHHQ